MILANQQGIQSNVPPLDFSRISVRNREDYEDTLLHSSSSPPSTSQGVSQFWTPDSSLRTFYTPIPNYSTPVESTNNSSDRFFDATFQSSSHLDISISNTSQLGI